VLFKQAESATFERLSTLTVRAPRDGVAHRRHDGVEWIFEDFLSCGMICGGVLDLGIA
jgi:hypothetical protein